MLSPDKVWTASAEGDPLAEELAALEDPNRAARPLFAHRLPFSPSHLAARPDRRKKAIEQALVLSMENTTCAALEKYSPQPHAVPSGSSGGSSIRRLVPSPALAYPQST